METSSVEGKSGENIVKLAREKHPLLKILEENAPETMITEEERLRVEVAELKAQLIVSQNIQASMEQTILEGFGHKANQCFENHQARVIRNLTELAESETSKRIYFQTELEKYIDSLQSFCKDINDEGSRVIEGMEKWFSKHEGEDWLKKIRESDQREANLVGINNSPKTVETEELTGAGKRNTDDEPGELVITAKLPPEKHSLLNCKNMGHAKKPRKSKSSVSDEASENSDIE